MRTDGETVSTLEEILTVTEVCELLRCPLATLRRWCSKREIPHYKVGRRVFFKRSELVEWFESHRATTKATIPGQGIAR